MPTSPIYSIGTLGQRQCAMRADGQWFERIRRINRLGWSKWLPVAHRPEHAWYNPQNGKAKLP